MALPAPGSPESLRDVPERIPRQQSVPAIAPAVVPLEEYVGGAFLLVELYTHVTDLPLGVCMPLAPPDLDVDLVEADAERHGMPAPQIASLLKVVEKGFKRFCKKSRRMYRERGLVRGRSGLPNSWVPANTSRGLPIYGQFWGRRIDFGAEQRRRREHLSVSPAASIPRAHPLGANALGRVRRSWPCRTCTAGRCSPPTPGSSSTPRPAST